MMKEPIDEGSMLICLCHVLTLARGLRPVPLSVLGAPSHSVPHQGVVLLAHVGRRRVVRRPGVRVGHLAEVDVLQVTAVHVWKREHRVYCLYTVNYFNTPPTAGEKRYQYTSPCNTFCYR